MLERKRANNLVEIQKFLSEEPQRLQGVTVYLYYPYSFIFYPYLFFTSIFFLSSAWFFIL